MEKKKTGTPDKKSGLPVFFSPDAVFRGFRSSRVQDIAIYGLCVIGILISLNLFRIDLFMTMTRQSEPIGIITFKYKAAQRRFVDRVLWDRLRRESPVYDGDIIRTAELAEASISFAGGAVIDLDENSLIQIHDDRQGPRVDINEGEISVSAMDSGMTLVSGDKRITVETGAVVNAGLDSGDFTLRVMEGAASFAAGGETGTAAAGETFALGEGGTRPVAGAAALSPRPQERFLSPGQEKLSVPFRWSRTNTEAVRLEAAADRAFTRVVFAGDFTGDTAAAELEPGVYFWRVAPADGEGSSSNVLSFKVVAASAPALITPVEGHRYLFRTRKPAVRFQWLETDEAAYYLLEAADNPEMANPVLSREVRGTSLYSSELGPGTWYWRVRPVFSSAYEGSPGEGVPASFTIVQSGSLSPPELRAPPERGVVNIAAGRGDIYFSWKNEPEALSYTIRISAKEDLSDPVITETVSDNFYVYRTGRNTIRPGRYYWGVFQTDSEGNGSGLSPARSFTAVEGEIVQRAIFPPEGYTIGSTLLPDIRFTWRSSLPMQTRFQISGVSDFSRMELDEAVSGESFQGRMLPLGTWYWRIESQGPDGTVLRTSPRSFIVAPPLSAPVPLEPGPEQRITIQEGETLRFVWEASPGADYYQFRLYRAGETERPVYENDFVEGTSQRLNMNEYPEGSYVWTVQGFAPENSRRTRLGSRSMESLFAVRQLFPVSLDYPENGAAIDGLQAYRRPGTVRWSFTDTPAASRFVLSRNRDLSGPPAAVENNPPRTLELPRLREGDYYWTILAETEDNFDISARTPRLIRVLPIPFLPEAENRLPRDGVVITGEELRRDRRIVFSWDPVPGASGYLFALEYGGKAIVPERLIAGLSFTLDEFGLLDMGDFVWRVEAVLAEPVREGDDYEIIQRGETGENRFRIAFTRPGVPDLPEPGVLYGRE